LSAFLKDKKFLMDTDLKEEESLVETQVQNAVAFAEAGTWEPLETLTKFVYSEKE
jgi:TPP-dependent pyruvate/acetoin dehydrogenase alpha subunit